ncbi:DNA/RNA non-specific endonuclease [Alistipes provencensis]|uniref:DNA/RNA non-specific endonuclease n=1 Tax=Alistipes provencensis TaxID=1816676 RepID=UPI000B1EBBDF|nr:DNA/RNA non-specific endonuclease [Alistipes provencensis]
MKKIFALLIAALSVAFVACGDEKTDNGNDWFLAPESSVDGTTVSLTCLTRFGDGVLEGLGAGFSCAALTDAGLDEFVDYTDVTVDGNRLSARVSGLQPETTYVFYAYAELPMGRTRSVSAAFETGKGGDDPGPGPDPDPDPDSGLTKYTGWAELPAVQDRPDDYYYAAHYCNGAPGGRNYSVCYSKDMRGPIWVAYPMHESYTKGTAGGQNQDWKFDPAIPAFVQPDLSSSYKASGDGSFSRGHMLASNDRQSDKATNKQTFYYTNMSPQIQNGFNGGIWATFEKKCHNMICSDTLYMVTGAYFANENTTCKDNSNPQKTVIVPTHFYKVLIRSKSGNTGRPLWELSADEIECAGYWFEHKAYSGASPSQFIKSVAWIEEKTKLSFFTNVPNAPKEKLDAAFWNKI